VLDWADDQHAHLALASDGYVVGCAVAIGALRASQNPYAANAKHPKAGTRKSGVQNGVAIIV
jgi:hypothetical protein